MFPDATHCFRRAFRLTGRVALPRARAIPCAGLSAQAGAPGAGRGFTLIEMLVVMLIIGLFTGLVATIVRPDDRAVLRLEAERLAQLLDLAASKARLTGTSVAWTAEASGYLFWQFADGTYWTEIRDDETLRARSLPRGITLTGLRVENRRPA
jgi:general secretion pathway protein H